MYIVNLIRERPSENEIYVDRFLAQDDIKDPETNIRATIAEYLTTDDGKKNIKETNYDFNWGDVLTAVPSDIWNKHGLAYQYSDIPSVDIKVNHDEILCDTSDEDNK